MEKSMLEALIALVGIGSLVYGSLSQAKKKTHPRPKGK